MPREGWPDWDTYVLRGCVCEYCGFDGSTSWQTWNQLVIDHIIPRCKGGARDAAMNKAVACCYCNGHKLWYDPRSPEQVTAGLAEPPDERSRLELISSVKEVAQLSREKCLGTRYYERRDTGISGYSAETRRIVPPPSTA
jgi:hypothetical protein